MYFKKSSFWQSNLSSSGLTEQDDYSIENSKFFKKEMVCFFYSDEYLWEVFYGIYCANMQELDYLNDAFPKLWLSKAAFLNQNCTVEW